MAASVLEDPTVKVMQAFHKYQTLLGDLVQNQEISKAPNNQEDQEIPVIDNKEKNQQKSKCWQHIKMQIMFLKLHRNCINMTMKTFKILTKQQK